MTEHEAEVLAARLTRIWAPNPDIREKADWSNLGRFGFSVQLRCDTRFWCQQTRFLTEVGSVEKFQFCLERREGIHCTGRLLCHVDDGKAVSARTQQEEEFTERFKQFASEWMPFFRRGCWLSGLPVEASAHERVEWIQGLTQEEIEAWNLKF